VRQWLAREGPVRAAVAAWLLAVLATFAYVMLVPHAPGGEWYADSLSYRLAMFCLFGFLPSLLILGVGMFAMHWLWPASLSKATSVEE